MGDVGWGAVEDEVAGSSGDPSGTRAPVWNWAWAERGRVIPAASEVVSMIDVFPLVDEGLGNSAYLVDLDDGRAMVVDVSLDLRATFDAARRRG